MTADISYKTQVPPFFNTPKFIGSSQLCSEDSPSWKKGCEVVRGYPPGRKPKSAPRKHSFHCICQRQEPVGDIYAHNNTL